MNVFLKTGEIIVCYCEIPSLQGTILGSSTNTILRKTCCGCVSKSAGVTIRIENRVKTAQV